MAKQNYEAIGNTVIVICPKGHKNQSQKVSDRMFEQRLVCANMTCKAQWDEFLPQIAGLEEAE